MINDGPGSQTCETWGSRGDDRIPIIINESQWGAPGEFNNWFSGSGDWANPYSSPWYILIDDEFVYRYISDIGASHEDVSEQINILLDENEE